MRDIISQGKIYRHTRRFFLKETFLLASKYENPFTNKLRNLVYDHKVHIANKTKKQFDEVRKNTNDAFFV